MCSGTLADDVFDKTQSLVFERRRRRIVKEMKELKILSTIESETNSKTISIDYQEESDGKNIGNENQSNDENFYRRLSTNDAFKGKKGNWDNIVGRDAVTTGTKSLAIIRQCFSQDEASPVVNDLKKLKHMHSTSCALSRKNCPSCINETSPTFKKLTFDSNYLGKLKMEAEEVMTLSKEEKNNDYQWMMKRAQFASAVKKKCAMWKTMSSEAAGEQAFPKTVRSHFFKQKHKQAQQTTKQIQIIIEHATTVEESSEGPDTNLRNQDKKLSNLKQHAQEEKRKILKCTKNGPHFFHLKKLKNCDEPINLSVVKPLDDVTPISKCDSSSLLNMKCKTDNESIEPKEELNLLPVSYSSGSLMENHNSLFKLGNIIPESTVSGQEFKVEERRTSVASSHVYRYTTDECLSQHGSFSCVSFADDYRRSRLSSTATNISERTKPVKKFSLRKKQKFSAAAINSNSSQYKSCISLSANSNCSSESSHSRRRREIEKHIAYSGFLISFAFSVLVLPTFILEIMNYFIKLTIELHLFVAVITWFRVIINPYLYGYLNPQYRLHCKHMWCNIK